MNIYIANLSHNVTDEDLKDLFSTYGTINSVKVVIDKETGESKGFGFVEMPNEEEGQKAIEELNGKPLHFEGEEEDTDSKVVKVSVARPRQAAPQPQRNANPGYRPNQGGYQQRRPYYGAPQGGYRNNNQGGYRPRRAPYGQGYNQGYNNGGYNQGYNNGYNQGYNNGGYDRGYNQGAQGYNQGSAQGSEMPQNGGYAQNNGYQGYNNQGGYRPRRYNNNPGYNRGYNNGGYNRGYNQGYNNQGYSAQPQEREFNSGAQNTEGFTPEQKSEEQN